MSTPFSQVPPLTFGLAQRQDLFYNGVFGQGAFASWADRRVTSVQSWRSTYVPDMWMIGEEEAWRYVRSRMSEAALIVGAVAQWHTLTAQQVSAFVGKSQAGTSTRGASYPSKLVRCLFALGVLDVGFPVVAWFNSSRNKGPCLVKIGRSKDVRRFVSELSLAERWCASGGLPVVGGPNGDRHNVLMAELALRVAQICDVGGVAGERVASVPVLAFDSVGMGRPSWCARSSSCADAVLVRRDGVRVAVELTASATPNLDAKTARWARTLASSPFDRSGLVVVFVEAGVSSGPALEGRVRRSVARAARLHPGGPSNRVAERMFVASWRDWFPEFERVNTDALGVLTARSAAGRSVELLDVWDVPSSKNRDLTCAVENLALCAGTPWWMRRLSVDVNGRALDSLGLRIDAVPPESRSGRRLGFGVNPDGHVVELPPRLGRFVESARVEAGV